MNISIEQLQLINLAIPTIFGLVGMVWGIIATILNHKSVPMSEVHAFLDRSQSAAAKTSNPLDDESVEIAKTIVKALEDLGLLPATVIASAPTVTTATTTTEPLYDPAQADR